jgi:HNH endonuclease
MPKMTPGYAKNTMRRALRAVIDPEPSASEIAKLWEYFGSACAYCGRGLSRGNREGHVDHLISGGTNHISNRVLSCPVCNGDEKREADWLVFLRKKTCDDQVFRKRRQRIESWHESNKSQEQSRIDAEVQAEIDRAISGFDNAVSNLRQLRQRLAQGA